MNLNSPTQPSPRDGWSFRLLAAVALLVLWFDVWTVRSSGDPWKFGKKQRDYYNLLIDGWLDGQLAMKVEVPAALLQLADPYDPAQRPAGLALHDATFYHGKYYLYFGVGPVVTLMLPFRLLTRTDLPQAVAVLVFVYGAFLASAAVWLRVRRKYFPESSAAIAALGVLALGFAGLGPVLLRRPQVWELPIAAAYCFAMLALLAVFESLHVRRGDDAALSATADQKSRRCWLAAASLFMGLAVASRPTYLVATPLLIVPLVFWWREKPSPPSWRDLIAAVSPIAAVGALLALHNFLRFGDPLQFGQAYQLSLDYEAKMAHFRPSYAVFNGWRYFFSSARWSEYFPFISPANLRGKPPGFGGHDDVYGLFANLPLAWLIFATPLALNRRPRAEAGPLGAWLAAVTILFFALAVVLLCFFGSLARYQLDFAPALILLACVGLLECERTAQRWPAALRVGTRLVLAVTTLASVAFAVLFSIQLNGLFPERNLAGYRATARVLNHVPAWIQWIRGERPAAWEVEFWLPRGGDGQAVTLLSVGDAPDIDRVFIRAVDAARVQVGFARAVMPDVVGEPITMNFLQAHRLRVTLGAFLPPDTHPWFGDAPPEEARLAARIVRLEIDGKLALQAFRRFDATAGGRVRVGPKSLGDAEHPRFVGELIGTARVPIALAELKLAPLAAAVAERGGTFALKLKRAPGPAPVGVCEPLLVTGATGRGDILGLEYLNDGDVRFVFDHWGSAPLRSAPLPLDLSAHELVIEMPWLVGAGDGRAERRGELRVVLDGGVVWAQPTMSYVVEPEEIAIGRNPIGGSVVGAKFSGELTGGLRARE